MNRKTIGLALFHDALYQVLDNKVFRILLILTVVLVAIPWLIGFREDEIVIAWGWKSYFYQDVLESMGWMLGSLPGTDQQRMIGGLENILVTGIAGTFGMFFCLAATSFFVPRLLEKGAADPLFSKPVSRFALLLSRYVAGLIFIAGLAIFLVGGIHLGLLVNSHYSDVSFLWTIPILVYTFALLFSFSVLVGVWTRSATAALLLSFLFLAFTGGIHVAWKALRMGEANETIQTMRQMSKELSDPELVEVREDIDGFAKFASNTLSVFHHVLPKTSDAQAIAELVREQLETPSFVHEFAFPLRNWTVRAGLRKDGILEIQSESEPKFLSPDAEGVYRANVQGREIEIVFEAGADPQAYGSAAAGPRVTVRGEVVELVPLEDIEESYFDPNEWFGQRFGWNSEWRYNAWYSIGSSLGFVLTMFGLSWLRLRRINF